MIHLVIFIQNYIGNFKNIICDKMAIIIKISSDGDSPDDYFNIKVISMKEEVL